MTLNRDLGNDKSLSPFTPITSNTLMAFAMKDQGFKLWAQKGIRKLKDLYDNDSLMSFQQLKETYQIPNSHFHRYLQIRHFISSSQSGSLIKPLLSPLETLLTQGIQSKHISLTYDLLLEYSKATTVMVKEK